MGRPTKFNAIVRIELLELYSRGYDYGTIANAMNVSRQVIHLWINKHNLRKELDEARSNSAKECIEVGLRKLASGVKEEEESDKYMFTRKATRLITQDDGTIEEEEYVQLVERTNKRKSKPPEVKAIEVLARKYSKEFDPKSIESDIGTKILEGFTMRELQEARKDNPIDQGKFIEAEFKELSDKGSDKG